MRKQVHNSSYQKLKIGNSKEQLFSYFFITIRLFSSAFSSIFENTDRTPVDKRKIKKIQRTSCQSVFSQLCLEAMEDTRTKTYTPFLIQFNGSFRLGSFKATVPKSPC